MEKNIDTGNTKRTGDITEIKAISWLLDQGYEVFKNVSCVGPIDIITYDTKTDEVVFIDVKTRDFKWPSSHTPYKTDFQEEAGVVILLYDPKIDMFKWENSDD